MQEEKRIIELFKSGTKILYHGETRTVIFCDKPLYHGGEGKTDIYILLDDNTEIKISVKQSNADFLQNKITKKWYDTYIRDYSILQNAINELKPYFLKRQVFYPEQVRNIKKNSYTMGFRFDIINKACGELCAKLKLTEAQKEEILYGTNLPREKRTVKVKNKLIKDCGVANCLLLNSENKMTAQEVIDNLSFAADYKEEMYATFRAVNYRMDEDKIDGNRALAVYIKWHNLTDYEMIFDAPLKYGAEKDILAHFKEVNNL